MSVETIVVPLATALVGGVVGASVKFTFDDVLSPFVSSRRELRQTVRQFTTPLIRAAISLESRINIMVRNEQGAWFEHDEYFRLSTLYIFGEYFGWVRIVERRFGFLPVESLSRSKRFNKRFYGIFRALTSNAYFRSVDPESANASSIPRFMLTAVGESMIDAETGRVIDFSVFARRYASDEQLRRWFSALDSFLTRAHPDEPLVWDRLILAGAQVWAIVRFLDPKGKIVAARSPRNLESLASDELAVTIREELGLSPPASAPPATQDVLESLAAVPLDE